MLQPQSVQFRRWLRMGCMGLPCFLCLLCFTTTSARADEFDAFEAAKSAYDAQNYPLATKRFSALQLKSRPLVLEAHKYLGASLLFTGKNAEAEAEFEKLLKEDGNYELDPVTFPVEVLDVFSKVKARLAKEHINSGDKSAAKKPGPIDPAMQRATLEKLITEAETERIVHTHSRWIAAIPFGVGQFQNGKKNAAAAFLIAETLLLSVSVVSFALHNNLYSETVTNENRQQAQTIESVTRITNWISTGLFVATAIGGIVEAQVNFVPKRIELRKRPLPKSWYEQLNVAPTSNGLLLRAAF